MTGAALPVTLSITGAGFTGGTSSGAPDPNRPAYNIFNGYIDFGNGTLNHAVQLPDPSSPTPVTPAATVSCAFTGLNPAKRYRFQGKVVSIDRRAKMADIDGEAIPGFMEAMTMPYQVKPADELNQLSAGDTITADVVVQNDDAWLENILVTGHSRAPAK